MRRKDLSPRMQASLPVRLAELEQEARARGVWVYCGAWRAYPDREHGLMFSVRSDGLEPPKAIKPKKPPKPASVAPDAAMTALEEQLAASLGARA